MLIILRAEFELSIASHIATPVIVKFLSKAQPHDLGSYISSNLKGKQATQTVKEFMQVSYVIGNQAIGIQHR